MAIFIINGYECNFYSIPHATLQNYLDGYGVTPRTYILAWQTLTDSLQLAVVMQIHAMYTIGAVEIPPLLVEDGKRTCYLLEHPSQTVVQNILNWIRYSSVKYLFECPYIIKRSENMVDLEREISFSKYQRPSYAKQLNEIKKECFTSAGPSLYTPTDENGNPVFIKDYQGTLANKPIEKQSHTTTNHA